MLKPAQVRRCDSACALRKASIAEIGDVRLTATPVAGAADECRRRRATTLTCRTSSRDPGYGQGRAGYSMQTRRHLRASMRLRRLPIPAGENVWRQTFATVH